MSGIGRLRNKINHVETEIEQLKHLIDRELISGRKRPSRGHIKSVDQYEFVGMWKNRNDMKNSVRWVRKQRENWISHI